MRDAIRGHQIGTSDDITGNQRQSDALRGHHDAIETYPKVYERREGSGGGLAATNSVKGRRQLWSSSLTPFLGKPSTSVSFTPTITLPTSRPLVAASEPAST